MNGVDLAKLHVAKGTRSIIDDIDDLRITFGFDAIEVTTPIVESRLRGGLYTLRPLGLYCHFPGKHLKLLLTFHEGFPKQNSLEVKVMVMSSNPCEPALQEVANTVQGTINADGMYTHAVCVVKAVLAKHLELHETIDVAPEEIQKPQESDDSVHDNDNAKINELADSPGVDTTEGESALLNTEESPQLETNHQSIYTCRTCRKQLFEYADLREHSQKYYNSHQCTSYYLAEEPESLKHTATAVSNSHDISGKLVCICGARVGNWSWAGNRCSCPEPHQEWIAPMFQFVKSKVDCKIIPQQQQQQQQQQPKEVDKEEQDETQG